MDRRSEDQERHVTPNGRRSAVAIMAKAPWPGEVKTRLCPPLSYAEAAELYRCFLLDKISQVNTLQRAVPVISYDRADAKSFFADLAPSSFVLVPQLGNDLGARLLSTFDQLFRQGYRRVMAIDSDSPTLPTLYLQHAIEVMDEREIDVVLGPSEDGGYYLIGLRRPYPELFEDMPWSTSHVLPETLRRSQAMGLKVACLESWYDIDTPDDLKRLKNSLEETEAGQAQHTRRFVTEGGW